MSNDLWPDFEAEQIKNPKSILVEQANFLGEKTKNVLLAEVKSRGEPTKKIIHSFDIVTPALSNYRFNLFHIRHEILYYPLEFIYNSKVEYVQTEKELMDKMKYVFNLKSTKDLINSLYSQSL